jgi:hypothetical protein
LKNSLSGQTNTGRIRALDVHRRPFSLATHLSAVLGNLSAVPHRTGRRLWRQGVLSQLSHLNLDGPKPSAGVFPRRLDFVLRYSGCDTLQRARETFKTSIELIDPAQKPIQPPDTRRGEIKTFDPSSSSRFICGVNLKSKI